MFQHSRSFMLTACKNNNKQKERRASLMILLMIFAFMVSWFPYTIICFFKMTGYEVTPTISALPLLFAKSSICWNPIIYVVLNEQVSGTIDIGTIKYLGTKQPEML